MSIIKSGYRGYVFAREFGGAKVPIPMQSLALRDYCQRKGYIYKLHQGENIFPHSYLVLDGIINHLKDLEGLLMCSMFILPKRSSRRKEIYQKIFDQGASLHFVLEDTVLRNFNDTILVEESLEINNLLPLCPSGLVLENSHNE